MPRRVTEWTYVELTLAAFVFAPELRRIADYVGGAFSVLNVFAILPIVMLAPIAVFVYRRRDIVRATAFPSIGWVWLGAFTYAFVIACAQLAFAPGLYGLALFVPPLLLGAWLVSRPETIDETFARLSRFLLIVGGIAGLYGVYQYIVAPPWDTLWMQNIDAGSFGFPIPFGIRVYSVLNGPGVFAIFTTFALLMNLRNIRLTRPLTLACVLFMVVSLVLSMVRVAWLGFAIGLIVTIALSPDRRRFASSLVVVFGIIAALGVSVISFIPNAELQSTIADRFATLGSLDDDYSAQDRAASAAAALSIALREPAGQGLGVTGTSGALVSDDAAKLIDVPANAIDNGYVSRMLEMGYLGSFAFFCALVIAIVVSFDAFRWRRSRNDAVGMSIIASMIATQVAMVCSELSGDVYSGIGGVEFFLAIGLALAGTATMKGSQAGMTRETGLI